MGYDAELADRVWFLISDLPGMGQKRMFGGVGYLLNGNMACGVHGNTLIVRLTPEESDAALVQPGVHPFDLTGRPMKGWITVDSAQIADQTSLAAWVERSLNFARSLPAK